MKNLRTSRLLAMFMCIAMMFTLLPLGLSADDSAVAKIGDTTYATLDAAIAAAADGDTIVLLQDCTTEGMNLSKNLTIDGQNHKIDFTTYGIALWGKSLTFKNCTVIMTDIGSTPYTTEWNWMTISASKDASLTLDKTVMTMDGTNTKSGTHAIYFCSNNKLNISNGSVLTIKNYQQDALEWDGGDGGYNVNITNSTFISDHNRSGFTGTFYATITKSNVDVINSLGNGSNGSHFIITDDSTVNFNGNGAHGLSAGNLTIDDSTVNANNNGANGIHTTGVFSVINDSVVNIENNACSISSKWTIPGALYVAGRGIIENSTVTIQNNKGSGIYQNSGTLTIDDRSDVTIVKNTAEKLGIGGGINVNGTVILSSNVKLYNNHAAIEADDIYCAATASITFGDVGSNWILDDCEPNHLIDGWYEDGNNQNGTRWTAHADNEEDNYIVEADSGSFVNQPLALKAAHGVDAVDPNDSEPEEPEIPIIIINFVNTIIQKIDSENGAPLAGAEFALYKSIGDEKPFRTGVTDENGQITFERLNENTTYYLVETKAPEGYVPNTTVYELTTGRFSDRTPSLIIENDKTEVPPALESGDHFAYIVGYPDGKVRPIGNITRAEVATIFFRLLTEEVRNENMTWDNPFSDVNVGDWYDCAISTLYAMGIINGYPDGTFDPNGFITRAEFAAIAARFDTIGNDFEESFGDVYGHWAEDEIAAAKAHGWLTGYEDGTFKPDQLITRAEAMTIVNRVLNRIPASADALLDDMVKWPDNADIDEWYYLAVQEATNSHFYERTDDNKEVWTEIREPRDWTELEK